MCFGGKPKITKAPPAPTVQIPPPPAIESTVPRTQSGADVGKVTQKRKRSLFQLDLTIPPTSTQQGSPTGAQTAESSTGPVIR